MDVRKIYKEDLQIAASLIKRDNVVTRKYFYQKCYPLFKSIYDNYYTDCESCKEFMDEIYLVVLSPSKITGKCQMENFRGESTLTKWIQTACLYYCYRKFEYKKKMPQNEKLPHSSEKDDEDTDRMEAIYGSIDIDFKHLNREDANTILNMMPNKRYSNIIRMVYLEHKTLEETAEALDMAMSNFYNKHKLAKEQYIRIWRKEGRNG